MNIVDRFTAYAAAFEDAYASDATRRPGAQF